MSALVFLDTETTGLGQYRQAWEIAAIRREEDGSETKLHLLLPIDPSKAEPGALNIGGYYERHPHGVAASTITVPAVVPTPGTVHPMNQTVTPVEKAAAKVAAFTDGATIVGANPAFDTATLERLLRANRYEPRWHFRLEDVEVMAKQELGLAQVRGLATTADLLGVFFDRKRAHTAMYDATVASECWDRLVELARDRRVAVDGLTGHPLPEDA